MRFECRCGTTNDSGIIVRTPKGKYLFICNYCHGCKEVENPRKRENRFPDRLLKRIHRGGG